jgi:hypothetical protein
MSIKLKIWVGLPVGWLIVNVRFVVPPTVKSALNALSIAGTAATTAKQAPVVDEPPPAALFATVAVTLLVALILPLPLVLLACGHVPTVGVAAVVMPTVIVHEVAGFTICRLVTVMVLEPATAVTVPPEHVPPTVDGLATTKPEGKVSVKLKVCVGFPVGCCTVNDRVCVPPTVRDPKKTLSSVGTACVTTRLADAVLPVSGPVAEIAPEVLL